MSGLVWSGVAFHTNIYVYIYIYIHLHICGGDDDNFIIAVSKRDGLAREGAWCMQKSESATKPSTSPGSNLEPISFCTTALERHDTGPIN